MWVIFHWLFIRFTVNFIKWLDFVEYLTSFLFSFRRQFSDLLHIIFISILEGVKVDIIFFTFWMRMLKWFLLNFIYCIFTIRTMVAIHWIGVTAAELSVYLFLLWRFLTLSLQSFLNPPCDLNCVLVDLIYIISPVFLVYLVIFRRILAFWLLPLWHLFLLFLCFKDNWLLLNRRCVSSLINQTLILLKVRLIFSLNLFLLKNFLLPLNISFFRRYIVKIT